jgi:hypothetical protein
VQALERAQAIAQAARDFDFGRHSSRIDGAVGSSVPAPVAAHESQPPPMPPSFEQTAAAVGPVRGASLNPSFYADAFDALAAPSTVARATALGRRFPPHRQFASSAVGAALSPQRPNFYEPPLPGAPLHPPQGLGFEGRHPQGLGFEGPGGHAEGPWQYFDAQEHGAVGRQSRGPSGVPPPKTPPGSPPLAPPRRDAAFYMRPTAATRGPSGAPFTSKAPRKAAARGAWRPGAAKGSVGPSVAEARAQQEVAAKLQRDQLAARSRARRAGVSSIGLLAAQAEVSDRLHRGRHVHGAMVSTAACRHRPRARRT